MTINRSVLNQLLIELIEVKASHAPSSPSARQPATRLSKTDDNAPETA